MVWAHNGSVCVCVCLVIASLDPVGVQMHLLGVCQRFLASTRVCITPCVSECVCVYCFLPVFLLLCTCVLFVRVGDCRFTGWAHLRSQAVVDFKVISLSSESLAVCAFISDPRLAPSSEPKHCTGVCPSASFFVLISTSSWCLNTRYLWYLCFV